MADTKSRPATIPFLSPATISPSCAARSRCSSNGATAWTPLWHRHGLAACEWLHNRHRVSLYPVHGGSRGNHSSHRSLYTEEVLHKKSLRGTTGTTSGLRGLARPSTYCRVYLYIYIYIHTNTNSYSYKAIIFPLYSHKNKIRFNPHDWLMIWGYTIQQIKGIQRIFPVLFWSIVIDLKKKCSAWYFLSDSHDISVRFPFYIPSRIPILYI